MELCERLERQCRCHYGAERKARVKKTRSVPILSCNSPSEHKFKCALIEQKGMEEKCMYRAYSSLTVSEEHTTSTSSSFHVLVVSHVSSNSASYVGSPTPAAPAHTEGEEATGRNERRG